MIKILHLVSSLETGGTERMLVDLLKKLKNEKTQKHIVCTLYDKGNLRDELDQEKIEVISLGIKSKFFLPLAIWKFIMLVKRKNPDVVVSYLLADNLVARIASKITGKKLICGKRNLDSLTSKLNVFLDCATLQLGDFNITNSKAGLRELASHGIKLGKIIYIPNGKEISNIKLTKEQAKIRIGLQKKDFAIGYVARLFQTKGHCYLLEAFAKISKNSKNAKLILVGDGETKDELVDLVKKQGLEDKVIFLGERKDINEILKAIDIFVFPSLNEGMPGALIEAMASGLPIAASNIEANANIVEHKKTGILFEAGNPEKLADAVIDLKNDKTLMKTLGKNAMEKAKKEFSLEKTAEKYKKAFEMVAKK